MPIDVRYLSYGDGKRLAIQSDPPHPVPADAPGDGATSTGTAAPDPASPFGQDPEPVSRLGDAVSVLRLTERIEHSLDEIRDFGAMAVERLSDLPNRPDKVTFEVAVKVSADLGVMVAKSSSEANFKIGFEWNRPDPGATDRP